MSRNRQVSGRGPVTLTSVVPLLVRVHVFPLVVDPRARLGHARRWSGKVGILPRGDSEGLLWVSVVRNKGVTSVQRWERGEVSVRGREGDVHLRRHCSCKRYPIWSVPITIKYAVRESILLEHDPTRGRGRAVRAHNHRSTKSHE